VLEDIYGNSSIMAFSFFVSSPHENVRCAKPIGNSTVGPNVSLGGNAKAPN